MVTERISAQGLYLYEAGDSTAPAILFLHGSPLSGRMWLPQLARLTDFHCLAPDLPEHGQSQDVRPFVMEDTVARLAALIRAASPTGRAHVVGLSFGGVVAQAMLAQASEVVDHVILSGTATRFGPTLLAALKAQVALSQWLMARLSSQQLGALMSLQLSLPAEYRPLLEEDMRRVPAEAMARFLLATYADIVTPTRATTPVLVAVGQRETVVARAMARRIHKTIAGSQGIVVPRANHVWNLQFPDLFAEVVRAWVTDRPLPEGMRAL